MRGNSMLKEAEHSLISHVISRAGDISGDISTDVQRLEEPRPSKRDEGGGQNPTVVGGKK